MWERWEASWEDMKLSSEEFLDAGDHVVVTAREWGRGRGSGIEVDVGTSASSRSATARWFAWWSTRSDLAPSKPRGCRSSRQLTLDLRRA
jgi:hypothetical protein